jgi:hypothetical protein
MLQNLKKTIQEVLFPMYFGFEKSMAGKSLKPEAKIFALTFIAFSAFSVSLLTINWNSRFLMPVLPLVFLVGSKSLVKWRVLNSQSVRFR